MPLLTLLYYLGVGGASVALVIAVVKARSTGAPMYASPVDPLEAAFLAGGPGRVADTALTAMHADGRLVLAGPGVVGVQHAVAHHPVESAVLDAHAAAPSGALHWLRIGVMRSPAVQLLGDGLAQRGLLVRPGELQPARRWAFGLTIASIVSFPLAIVLTVIQFAGSDDSFSVPFVFQVIPALLIGFIVGSTCMAMTSARLTGAGKVALARFRSLDNGFDPVHTVACQGPRGVQDPMLRAQLTSAGRMRAHSPAAQASAGGGVVFIGDTTVTWCGGGGSGCGGSSCGGGSGGGGSSCGGSSGSSCGGSSGGSSCGGSSGGSSCGGGGGGD
ncbi:TIGR04222 domain-containing membrane protein [Streptomyces sp. YC537]|uniref:TIGR04222 domain-containing membrane protein n=1 Tax=Streptomyces boluensis TaxID=1775135 RepID=A0A964XLF4_9ACTN|nr:TIGR04222 domain-containing membrane protein [Streptomyces boluensis]